MCVKRCLSMGNQKGKFVFCGRISRYQKHVSSNICQLYDSKKKKKKKTPTHILSPHVKVGGLIIIICLHVSTTRRPMET